MDTQRGTPSSGVVFIVIGVVALAVVAISVTRIAIGESDNFWTPLGSVLTATAMIIAFVNSRREPRRRVQADDADSDARP